MIGGAQSPTAAVAWILRLAHGCTAMHGWRAALAAFAAGAGSVLAMAPFFASPVLFISLPVLIWLSDGAVGRKASPFAAFWPGWWFGFGYFLLGLFWIGEAFLVEADRFLWLLPVAVTLLPAGLAIFFGLATTAAAALHRRGLGRVTALALALSASEWLRGHILTGFPWNTLGYALTMPLPLMQWAGLIGIYGLTLAAVLIFATPALYLADRGNAPGTTLRALALATVPLLAMMLCGVVMLATITEAPVPGVRIRLVQPSVPQREKWRPENQRQIFFDHIELSRQKPDGSPDEQMNGIAAVVWPEAAMPFQPLNTPVALAAIADMLPAGKVLIAGALRTVERPSGPIEARNSLMIFNDQGAAIAIYDKLHLVPFGEYLPARWLLERIGLEEIAHSRGGFGIGDSPRPLLLANGLPAMLPLICYEAIFPATLVQTAQRPQVMVNVTNDGWFGDSTGPRQHFHQARVRAVEEGLPLVRAANNGISAVIAPSGRIVASIGLNRRGSIDADLPRSVGRPPYARYGDGVFALIWLVTLAQAMIRARQTR